MRAASLLPVGVVAAVFSGLASVPASAALVTLCGPNICYEYDNDPAVNAGITLFGAPSLLSMSDVLEFTPTAFSASSSGGPVTTSAVFQFKRIYSIGGEEIASITVAESGDYQILQAGGWVNANLRLQVVDQTNDNPTPGFPEVVAPQFNWNSSTVTGFPLANWSLTGTVTPAASFDDLATVVDLQIQNMLQAFAPAGGFSYIQKKLTLTTAVVPVPAAVWLFGSGLALLGWLRRRPS